MIYYDSHMNNEIIQSVTYDNYDDFQCVNFIFSQIFISLFWGLFNDEKGKVYIFVGHSHKYKKCWIMC